MPDHQTSPVGEDAERADFEAWHRSKFATKHSTGQPTRDMHNGIYAEKYGPEHQQQMWEAWQAARRAAPALDASGLPRVKTWQERCDWWSDRSSTKLMVEAMKDEIADLRAQLEGAQAHFLAAQDQAEHYRAKCAAPTQPKAQVGSIEDYAQFHHLLDSWMGLSGEHQNDAAPQVTEAWRKFIDYIDASAGSRAGDAGPNGWKLVPIDPTDDMIVAFAEQWYSKVRCIDDCQMEDCYAAMLAAAPAPGKHASNDLDVRDADQT